MIKHYLYKTWVEVDATGPIRTCWFCNCGGGGSVWGADIKKHDKRIADAIKKHARAQGGWSR